MCIRDSSNIILRFYGWVDQSQTDFLKGRSRGIHAVKAAFEAGGFSLPEPIYRLRYDTPAPSAPAGPAIPEPASAQPQPRARDDQASHEALDTAPAPAVERLVQEERSDRKSGDLLDDRRPIE